MVYFNGDIYLYQNLIMRLSLIGAEPSVIHKNHSREEYQVFKDFRDFVLLRNYIICSKRVVRILVILNVIFM